MDGGIRDANGLARRGAGGHTQSDSNSIPVFARVASVVLLAMGPRRGGLYLSRRREEGMRKSMYHEE